MCTTRIPVCTAPDYPTYRVLGCCTCLGVRKHARKPPTTGPGRCAHRDSGCKHRGRCFLTAQNPPPDLGAIPQTDRPTTDTARACGRVDPQTDHATARLSDVSAAWRMIRLWMERWCASSQIFQVVLFLQAIQVSFVLTPTRAAGRGAMGVASRGGGHFDL